jgi:hypothetical protein
LCWLSVFLSQHSLTYSFPWVILIHPDIHIAETTDTMAKKETLEEARLRIRRNQQRSRQKRREYIEEMGAELREAKVEGIKPGPVIERIYRNFLNENESLILEGEALKSILTETLGLTLSQVDDELVKNGEPPMKDWRAEREKYSMPLASVLPATSRSSDDSSRVSFSTSTTTTIEDQVENESLELNPASSIQCIQTPIAMEAFMDEDVAPQYAPAIDILSSGTYQPEISLPMALELSSLRSPVEIGTASNTYPFNTVVYNVQCAPYFPESQFSCDTQQLHLEPSQPMQIEVVQPYLPPYVGRDSQPQPEIEHNQQQQPNFMFYSP